MVFSLFVVISIVLVKFSCVGLFCGLVVNLKSCERCWIIVFFVVVKLIVGVWFGVVIG